MSDSGRNLFPALFLVCRFHNRRNGRLTCRDRCSTIYKPNNSNTLTERHRSYMSEMRAEASYRAYIACFLLIGVEEHDPQFRHGRSGMDTIAYRYNIAASHCVRSACNLIVRRELPHGLSAHPLRSPLWVTLLRDRQARKKAEGRSLKGSRKCCPRQVNRFLSGSPAQRHPYLVGKME